MTPSSGIVQLVSLQRATESERVCHTLSDSNTLQPGISQPSELVDLPRMIRRIISLYFHTVFDSSCPDSCGGSMSRTFVKVSRMRDRLSYVWV